MSLSYETFATTPCLFSDVLRFADEVNAKFPGSELAVNQPFAGKLVVPKAPSVDCYGADAGSYRVEVYGRHDSSALMQSMEWNLPRYQALRHDFERSGLLQDIRIGISFIGAGVNPRHKSKSWQPSICLALNAETSSSEDRARTIRELAVLAGCKPPKVVRINDTIFLQLPDAVTYSVEGMRPDLDSETSVAEPVAINLIAENSAESVLSLTKELQKELGAGDSTNSTFAFNADNAAEYDRLKNHFETQLNPASVWQVKPKVPTLCQQAREALEGSGDAGNLEVLPLLEINDGQHMHPVTAIRYTDQSSDQSSKQGADQWQLVVGTYRVDEKTWLRESLTPFVTGWISAPN